MDRELKAVRENNALLQQMVYDHEATIRAQETTIKAHEGTIATRDARISELEPVEKVLQPEEDQLRQQCVDAYKERGKRASKERSEDDLNTYQAKIEPMHFSQLRAELKEQQEGRDIYKKSPSDPELPKDEYKEPFTRSASLRGLGL